MPMLIMFRMRLPVCPFHAPLRIRFGKYRHLVEHGVNLGNDVHAIGEDLCALWSAQGDMQNRALLGDVDLVAREHGVDVLAQAGLLRKLEEQPDCFAGDSVLRVVEVETQGLQREAFAALGILREELPKMQTADLGAMLLQRVPGRPVAERNDGVRAVAEWSCWISAGGFESGAL